MCPHRHQRCRPQQQRLLKCRQLVFPQRYPLHLFPQLRPPHLIPRLTLPMLPHTTRLKFRRQGYPLRARLILPPSIQLLHPRTHRHCRRQREYQPNRQPHSTPRSGRPKTRRACRRTIRLGHRPGSQHNYPPNTPHTFRLRFPPQCRLFHLPWFPQRRIRAAYRPPLTQQWCLLQLRHVIPQLLRRLCLRPPMSRHLHQLTPPQCRLPPYRPPHRRLRRPL